MLSRLRIRGKLALLVLIPLLTVVGLTVPVVLDRAEQADRASDTADSVRMAGRVGALIQKIQIERLLSVGFLMRTVERSRVEQQVAAVNTHAAQLTSEAAGDDPANELPAQVTSAIAGLGKLTPLRNGVLGGITAPDKLIVGYGEVVTALLDSLALERGVDVSTTEGRQVVALDASLRTDELIAAGAAYLVIAAATRNSEALLPYFTNLAVLSATVARFTAFATAQQTELYSQVQADLQKRLGTTEFTPTQNVNPIQALTQVPLATVFTALEGVVGPGRQVSDRIIADVTDQVTEDRRRALSAAYLVVGLSLLVLLLVTLLSVAVARGVVRPLTRLTRSADRVARVTEEELTRVADDEVERSGAIELETVDVGARDEIGDLARAFQRVQGTAAGLVERQVASRRNVAQMFGHVGRRTQNLVARQIALIDRLEGEETDPTRLQHLYRLDHVSSRLRRNAGSLVVLSGSTSANEHLNPLPLGDVVRLALGEIEDYTRVDVMVPAELTLTPAAINDLVLVLAELMENATAFSPPHTRVTVSAQPTAQGARVAVIDHGIGLPEEQMARENARLQRRERLDLAPTGVLGLFVVGRLARRHNLGVALTGTSGGGTTAVVDIGHELLAASWAATPALPAGAAPRTPAALAAGPPGSGRPDQSWPPPPGQRGKPANPANPANPAGPARAAAPVPVEYVTVPPAAEPAEEARPARSQGFNIAAVDRASHSISTGTSWSAFVPRQRTGSGKDQPTAGRPAPGIPVPAGAERRTGIEDQPTTLLPAVTAASARALVEEFESGVRRAQSQTQGLPTIEQPSPGPNGSALPLAPPRPPRTASPPSPLAPPARPQPVPPPTSAPLTRRQPGATLNGQPELSRASASPANQRPPDPDEARELVEQFEAGVMQALGEVRSHYRPDEGSSQ